jgi:hypothetical protein
VKIHRAHFAKAALLDPKLTGFSCAGSEADGITTLKLNRPAKVDPYATVVQVDFSPN